ncbi:MAG: hypothetical protein R3B47_08120 [Bacteroidia bacterium]
MIPKTQRFHIDRAQAFLGYKDYPNAIRDLDHVVNQSPNDYNTYNARASVKYEAGDLNGACLDWSRAGELGDVNAYKKIREV